MLIAMRTPFPLFQNHLDVAHAYWRRVILPGDTVIDATCGNGHDTLVLALLALTEKSGKVIACDIQQQALMASQKLLTEHLDPTLCARLQWVEGCHSHFSVDIAEKSVKVIAYNLGYLPGGNKNITTMTATTIESIRSALSLVAPGGLITITCYPGHKEGLVEQEKVVAFVQQLPPDRWSCCHHQWVNRDQAPSLIVIQSVNG